MNQNKDTELLTNCYVNSLKLAVESGSETISFPSISTGALGYPRHEAARIASRAIKFFLESVENIKQVNLVFFSSADAEKFIKHQNF